MYPYLYPSYFNPYKGGSSTMYPIDGEAPITSYTTSTPPVEPVTPAPPIPGPAVNFQKQPGPPVTTDINYTQAYLKSKIGSKVKIEFLIGTNLLTDRTGTLVDVGISYVIIRLQETDDYMLGDIYSIKFVTFFR